MYYNGKIFLYCSWFVSVFNLPMCFLLKNKQDKDLPAFVNMNSYYQRVSPIRNDSIGKKWVSPYVQYDVKPEQYTKETILYVILLLFIATQTIHFLILNFGYFQNTKTIKIEYLNVCCAGRV